MKPDKQDQISALALSSDLLPFLHQESSNNEPAHSRDPSAWEHLTSSEMVNLLSSPVSQNEANLRVLYYPLWG